MVFDPALVDRAVPPGTNADDNRLEALNLILRGWPAEAAVTPEGFLYVTADTDSAVVNTALTDGLGGTVIRSDGSSTRVGVYNAVVARGNNAAGTAIQAVAYDRTTPKRDGGPFSELPVPLFYDTPFVNNQKVAQIIAATRLRTLLRQAARSFDVEMVPNPAIQVGDRLALTVAREVPGLQVLVDALTLPLTADGGAMTMRVRVA